MYVPTERWASQPHSRPIDITCYKDINRGTRLYWETIGCVGTHHVMQHSMHDAAPLGAAAPKTRLKPLRVGASLVHAGLIDCTTVAKAARLSLDQGTAVVSTVLHRPVKPVDSSKNGSVALVISGPQPRSVGSSGVFPIPAVLSARRTGIQGHSASKLEPG